MNEDPEGFGAGTNFYGYVENDPVEFSDPFGLCLPNKKKCGVKSLGYDKTGSIPKNTRIQLRAEFLNDATHDPHCCEVRQMVWWNKPWSTAGNGGPNIGFAGDDAPQQWHEDRSPTGNQYGHRGVAGSYGTYSDNGFSASDQPGTSGLPGFDYPTGEVLKLRLIVIDTCNGGKTVATSKTLTVNF